MNLDKLDSFLASQARPFSIYVLVIAIFACCFIPATSNEALGIAGTVVVGYGAARTVEKVRGVTSASPTAPPGASP